MENSSLQVRRTQSFPQKRSALGSPGERMGCACAAKTGIWHSMTMSQYWHKLKRPRENGKTSPPPRPGGERDECWGGQGDRPVEGGAGATADLQCVQTGVDFPRLPSILQESSPGWNNQCVQPSIQVRFFVTQDVGPGGRAGGTSDDFHPPLECVFTFRSEVVHVGLEMQLKHIVLVNVLRFRGDGE